MNSDYSMGPYTVAEIVEIRKRVENSRGNYDDSPLGAALLGRDCRLLATLKDLVDSKPPVAEADPRLYPMSPMTLHEHGDGTDATFHPVDKPCANCRPPIVITDEMVQRSVHSIRDRMSPQYLDSQISNFVYDALEAALNG